MTPDKAQQDYQAAMAALDKLAGTPGLDPSARITISRAIKEVTSTYLDHVEAEIEALTAQYEDFINSMGEVLVDLQDANTPSSLLQSLTKVVKNGGKLVGAVIGPAQGAKAFGSGRRPAGHRPAGRRPAAKAFASERETLRILCVHGVGHQEGDPAFESSWREVISSGISEWSRDRVAQVEFVRYDDLFAADPPDAGDVARAVIRMGASGLIHGIGDLFHRSRGFGDVAESVRWTAGMVVQWAESRRLRGDSRQRVWDHVAAFDPHVILAHSLGTLLSYDAFARPRGRKLLDGRTFVTFGSQIGNPFVRSTLGGRIEPLPGARHWYHLYNPHDDAFTASLRIPSANFEQVDTEFDIAGMLDHDAREYLGHPNTRNIVWRAIALPDGGARGLSRDGSPLMLARRANKARPAKVSKPHRRALLVGINDYPDPSDRLQGCVNDVFLMSSLLQESGFDADDIRVVLNERATARGIVERLEWLLDGAEDGQERVFFYSGHGAQIPGYGVGEKVDRKDECLVAYDFDWSRDHAVTDDQFFDLYSQLPYDTQFLTIFDCCHSGGMTREGAARIRGLTPPDDIRHRELKWSPAQQMWVPRDFKEVKKLVSERRKRPKLFGKDGDLNRLGRSADLRTDEHDFKAACKEYGHKGPFMPIIFQACGEKQYSYEYRHGVQSYGAFTYSLGLIMRDAKARKRKLTWSQLIAAVSRKLETLDYDQDPVLVCPTALKNDPVPWNTK